MRYSLHRVLRRLQSQGKVYVAVFLLVATGCSILALGLNRYFASQRLHSQLLQQMGSHNITIIAYLKDVPEHERPINITYQDYLELSAKYEGELDMQYSLFANLGFFHPDGEAFPPPEPDVTPGLFSLIVLFISPQQFEEKLGMPMQPGVYYAGDAVLEGLAKFQGIHRVTREEKFFEDPQREDTYSDFGSGNVDISNGRLVIGQTEYTLTPLQPHHQDILLFNSTTNLYAMQGNYTLHNFVIFPLEENGILEDILEGSTYIPSCTLRVRIVNNNTASVLNLLDDLNARKGEYYEFRADDQYFRAQEMIQQHTYDVRRQAWMAVFELLMVGFSTAGLMVIFLNRRKADVAISIMAGATFRRQVLELLGEVSLVIFTATAAGTAAAAILGQVTESGNIPRTFSPLTLLILLGVAVALTALSSSLALAGLKNLSPMEVLREA